MILDSEQQRTLLLQLLGASTVPGQFIDVAYNLKCAINKAVVQPTSKSGGEAQKADI